MQDARLVNHDSVLGLVPEWPAPSSVRAFSTFRSGGVSFGGERALNLAAHVEDDPTSVARNRQQLAQALGLNADEFGWLRQVHGTRVVTLPASLDTEADASISRASGTVCAVLTADCLPVLFCDRQGTQVAAAHAGWRGLCAGILEKTLSQFDSPAQVMAWLGPAIGPSAFEVGEEVRDAFIAENADDAGAFVPSARGGHFYADLYQLARQRLVRAGIGSVYGGGECTFSQADRYFSYRRQSQTGRQATLIWLTDLDD